MEKVLTEKFLCNDEGAIEQTKRATNASEGKTFAKQTVMNLPSYRPNVLSTSDKLDCHARPADGGNGARNDITPLVSLSALVPSKRVAFTLAEVLITLGIIGVVAALTIPNTVNDYRERKKVVKLKKVYAQLSEIYDRATSEKGFVSDRFAKYSSLYSKEGNIAFRDYFMSYYKVSVEGTQNEAYQTSGYTAFWDKLSGTRYGWCRDNDSMATFADNTGTAYAFRLLPPNKHCVGNFGAYADNISVCGEIFVDLYPNPKSLSKPKYADVPSRTVGKDIFMFHVTKDGIVPAGVSGDMSKCYKDGWSCAQWVILNENMDYLHCKDLDWGGKHKCD